MAPKPSPSEVATRAQATLEESLGDLVKSIASVEAAACAEMQPDAPLVPPLSDHIPVPTTVAAVVKAPSALLDRQVSGYCSLGDIVESVRTCPDTSLPTTHVCRKTGCGTVRLSCSHVYHEQCWHKRRAAQYGAYLNACAEHIGEQLVSQMETGSLPESVCCMLQCNVCYQGVYEQLACSEKGQSKYVALVGAIPVVWLARPWTIPHPSHHILHGDEPKEGRPMDLWSRALVGYLKMYAPALQQWRYDRAYVPVPPVCSSERADGVGTPTK